MNRYLLGRMMNSDGRRGGRRSDSRRDRYSSGDGYGYDQRRGRSRDREFESGYDERSRDGRYDDYADDGEFEYNSKSHMELSRSDLEEWERRLRNADGTRGGKFTREQVIPVARQRGIAFDEFTEDEFVITVNMLYSDYCKVFQKIGVSAYNKPELYTLMAKAFLCDEDFEGEPYEKLALYYYAIVDFGE